jgi:hypothetical protein
MESRRNHGNEGERRSETVMNGENKEREDERMMNDDETK